MKIKRLRWFLRQLASRSFTFLLSQESARSWRASWKKSRAKTDSSRYNSYQPVFFVFFFVLFYVAANFLNEAISFVFKPLIKQMINFSSDNGNHFSKRFMKPYCLI